MPYLNLDLDYFTHPKTSRLVGLLGRGAAELPIRLWAYCGKHHSESGNLTGYSAQEIETVVGWWGGTGKMVEAMLNVGFLDKIENGFKIHGWKDHAGHLSVFKKRAKSAAKERWKKYARSNASSNAQDKITNAPNLTLPNQPNQNKKEAREVLEFLNEKAGKNFRLVDANINLIAARLKSGATAAQCRQIIALKCRKWKGDPKTEEWLRPSTLFGKEKFEQYIGELLIHVDDNGLS